MVTEDEKIKFYEVDDFKEAFSKYGSHILKLIIIETKKYKIEDAKEDIEKLKDYVDIVYSWSGCAEFMAKGTSKGNAVKMLAKKFGIKKR